MFEPDIRLARYDRLINAVVAQFFHKKFKPNAFLKICFLNLNTLLEFINKSLMNYVNYKY
ncbi:hypothetical protein T05_12558 [Trichinella murrelli]|uniref:Uncharacterized protein n=1 Tax=Trichinella murrelli TaxID=144512 RepID=A0A0V0TCS5_9BILA|nr:hypothetical protein T05_12558 [Trichinella murrelli]